MTENVKTVQGPSGACGAKTRSGRPCAAPALANGRCRACGGLSTGPRTAEGRQRCRDARWKHGYFSAQARAMRRAFRNLRRAQCAARIAVRDDPGSAMAILVSFGDRIAEMEAALAYNERSS